MIENTLNRIAEANERIAAILEKWGGGAVPEPGRGSGDPAPSSGPSSPPPPAEPAPRTRGRPRKEATAATPPAAPPVPAEPPETIEDSAADFLSDVAPPPTREDVRSWLVKLGKAHQNAERGRKLLKQYGGVDVLGSLPEAKFAAVIEACQKDMPQ